jgi:hypothetical protein
MLLIYTTCLSSPRRSTQAFSVVAPPSALSRTPTDQAYTISTPNLDGLTTNSLPHGEVPITLTIRAPAHIDWMPVQQSAPPLQAAISPLFREVRRAAMARKTLSKPSLQTSTTAVPMTATQIRSILLMFIARFVLKEFDHARATTDLREFLSKQATKGTTFYKTNHRVQGIHDNLQFVWNAAGEAIIEHGLSDAQSLQLLKSNDATMPANGIKIPLIQYDPAFLF